MTINDIAKLAGVSISTVSKIMNGKDEHINPQTRSRVLKIIKEYNYVPYSAVRNDLNTRSFILGVLISSLNQYHSLLPYLTQTAQDCGYTLLLLDSQEDSVLEARHIASLCKNSVDGLLWNPVSPNTQKQELDLRKHGIPYLFFDGFEQQSSITFDYQSLAYLLTDHLIRHGHQNIACVLPRHHRDTKKFQDGFTQCLYENHISFRERLAIIYDDTDYISDMMNRDVTAVVLMDTYTALNIHYEYSVLQKNIPKDLSIVTLQDVENVSKFLPELSSISLDYSGYAVFLCKQLISACEHHLEEISGLYQLTDTMISDATVSEPFSLHSGKITVIGSINADITFHVSSLPQSGKTVRISSAFSTLGGKGANQSIGVSRLHHEVSLIGELGNDSEANVIFNSLGNENVNTSEVHRDRTSQTGKAYIYLEPNGESAITILPGANNSLKPADIQARKQQIVRADYCLISSEIPVDTVIEAAKTAKASKTVTILKPASIREMPEDLYPLIDILVPNRKEAALLCPIEGASVTEQASYFHEKGISTVIITLGRQGFYLSTETSSQFYAASDFTPLDTTGGADAFIAALASYLSDGYSLESATQIANYAAGFCVSRQGICSALVDRFTLETHIMKVQPELLSHKEVSFS